MPVIDGFEATRMIRENEHSTDRRTPIIAITTSSPDYAKLGFDAMITKPVDLDLLSKTMNGLIVRARELQLQ